MATLDQLAAQVAALQKTVAGMPQTPDDYYTHQFSGEEIDAAVRRNDTLTRANLLINGDFRAGCLVDQRQGMIVPKGKTAYSDAACTTEAGTLQSAYTATYVSASAYSIAYGSATRYVKAADVVRGYVGTGYGVDMFRQDTAACVSLIEDDGVTLTHLAGGIVLYRWTFPSLVSGRYTASLLYRKPDGALGLVSRTFDAPAGVELDVQEIIPGVSGWVLSPQITAADRSAGVARLRIFNRMETTGQTIKVVATKWELGDTQTLAHQDSSGNWVLNEAPSYADTLRACQRYLRPVLMSSWGDVNITAVLNSAKTRLEMRVDMRGNPMRTKPSLIVSGTNSVRAVFVGDSGLSVVPSLLEGVISSAACVSYVSVGIVPASDAAYTARSLADGVSVDAFGISSLKAFLSAEL